MRNVERILIVQTAFLGDVVLTLPLVQVVKDFFVFSKIDLVVVPRSADLVHTHPSINEVIVYDKYGTDKGVAGLFKLVRQLRMKRYDLALIPHRSLRSALLVFLAGIPLRIGFTKSAGRFLFSKTVHYQPDLHEAERNLSLLEALGIPYTMHVLPKLYPSPDDSKVVDTLLDDLNVGNRQRLIAIAPGTIWNTKRWLKERFAALAQMLVEEKFEVLLVGGKEDVSLCSEIQNLSQSATVYSSAGMLTTIQSAELIRRCKALISNDSAPMHFAVAVGTPVVSIFGATVPEFGFAPYGKHDVVLETKGLPCRPCSIHGGDECPIKTFECMKAITYERVFGKVMEVIEKTESA
ncbi:MAG: lipopolysaccharide heptosyltransferase II [Bacteroidota bacterium]